MCHMEAKMQDRFDAADDELRRRQKDGVICDECGGSGQIIHAVGVGLEYEEAVERCPKCEGFGALRIES